MRKQSATVGCEDQYFLARVVRDDGDQQEVVLTPAIMEHEVATAR